MLRFFHQAGPIVFILFLGGCRNLAQEDGLSVAKPIVSMAPGPRLRPDEREKAVYPAGIQGGNYRRAICSGISACAADCR
jgi:hypothetical protein